MLTKRCPACSAEWRDGAARFCGNCGALLPGSTSRGRRRIPPAASHAAVLSLVLIAFGIGFAQLGGASFGRSDDGAPESIDGDVRVTEPPEGSSSDVEPPDNERVPRAIGGGLLVVVDGDRVRASDAVTGSDRFDVSLTGLGLDQAPSRSGSARDSARVPASSLSLRAHERGVVIAGGGVTVAIDRWGTRQWRHSSGRSQTTVIAADEDRAVLSGPSAREGHVLLEVVDTSDGTVRFGREIAALVGVEEQTAIVLDAGEESGVTAVSLQDGSVRWHLARGGAGALDGR